MERAEDFQLIFFDANRCDFTIATKIPAGIRVQRYVWLLNQLKVQQIHLANCVEEVWDQPRKDCESVCNQNHLNWGSNLPQIT